jgi:hypothetical protein
MSTRNDYGELAARLDYAALEKKLSQLAEREPPKTRKTAADLLEPLRERLLALHRKGWSSGQLVEELKIAGVPVSPARFRECLTRWTGNGNGKAKSRANRRQGSAARPQKGTGALPQAAGPVARSQGAASDGQPGLKFANR